MPNFLKAEKLLFIQNAHSRPCPIRIERTSAHFVGLILSFHLAAVEAKNSRSIELWRLALKGAYYEPVPYYTIFIYDQTYFIKTMKMWS